MCKKCKNKVEYRESNRAHKRPPRKFFICSFCDAEVQGVYNVDGTVHEFSTSVYKGGSHTVPTRLSDEQFKYFKSLGKTSREVFELGLETYKNTQK